MKMGKNLNSKDSDGKPSVLLNLSPEQLKAATLDSPAIRMSACAGSGKTETLTGRIVHLLQNGADPSSVVAFTFTDRAAKNMKSRIHKRVIENYGLEARQTLAPMFVGTIHSYCLRMLQDHAGYDTYDVLDEHRETAFAIEHGRELRLQEIAQNILRRKIGYSAAVAIFLRSLSVVNDELIDRGLLRRFSPVFAELVGQYEKLMADHLVFNFGQLITLAIQVLEQKGYIREIAAGSIRHLLVDEYQDLNPAQEKLIQLLLSKGGHLFVVGDANQCIYQWRGSDVRCFEHFEQRFPQSKAIFLQLNRRSTSDIIEVANKFASTIDKTIDIKMIPYREESNQSVWWIEHLSPNEEAAWVADKIIQLNESGVRFSDIAILLRSVNTAGAAFIQEFKQKRIPYILGGRIGIFRRQEAQALGRIFAWLSDTPWIEAPYQGSRSQQTKFLLETALIDNWGCTDEQYPKFKSKFEGLKTAVLKNQFRNLTEVFRNVINILGFLEFNPENTTDRSLMALLGRFNQLLTDFESTIKRQDISNDSTETSTNLKGLINGFTWYVNTYATSAYEEESTEDMKEADAVALTTVHQSKGLEWPVVFVSSLISRRFPSSKCGQRREWLIHRGIFDTQRYEGTILDERRLFYVAITRAKDGLYLSWFRKGEKQSADRSPFIWATLPPDQDIRPENAGISQVVSTSLEEEPEMTTYTPSELIWYRRCPYNYLLRKVWGFQPGLARELGYGKALHHIMRLVGNEVRQGKKIDTDIARRIIDEHFYLPYAPPTMAQAMKESATQKIERFIENNIDDIHRIQQVEARLEFPIGQALVYGIVDVILRHDGETVEARDYKTTKADRYSNDEANFQIRLYSAGLKQMGYPVAFASIANLEEEEVRSIDISNNVLSSVVEETQGYILGIKTKDYTAKPSQYCRNCDYRDICRYYKVTEL
jgi:DNA helicase-2/ATP-dependent DNA helicase PcrA